MSATTTSPTPGKDAAAFRTISEVADALKLPQHVLRFWETRFTQIKPLKRAGGRRFYRPQDVELLAAIRHLLYGEGYTIKGVQRILREQGPRGVVSIVARPGAAGLATGGDGPTDESMPSAIEGAFPDEAGATAATLRSVLAELAECRRLLSEAMDEA